MIDWWLSIFAPFVVLIFPYYPEDIFRLLSTHFGSHETDLSLIVKLKNFKVRKKYELEKNYEIHIAKKLPFLMKTQYCHFQKCFAKNLP